MFSLKNENTKLSFCLCKKANREGRKLGWLSKELLVKLRHKKEMHRQWKQEHVAWKEHRDAAQMYRDGIRKAKAQVELSLARDAKSNKKRLYRYIGRRVYLL